MGISIKIYPYGMYGENTYLITDEKTGLKAIVDPGYYSEKVRCDIGNSQSLKYLLLTHGHHDHFNAVSDYLNEYKDVVFAAPSGDKAIMKSCPEAHIWLKDGDEIALGETTLKVIATPGHTAGGICFSTDSEIFTGDTLFKMSVGRTDLESGDWDTLVKSIKERLYVLDDDMEVYSGHGVKTTIGFEKRANPFV
ncbi:MAG: MBL fold metallo-hydrolase [Mogibacterium sp.]|nr:MBL fold metallo-hydrolase [Mogibacterium sp.]